MPYSVFMDHPMGAALHTQIKSRVVVTRARGVPYILDVLEAAPLALIVRDDMREAEHLLACFELASGEFLYLGPKLRELSLTHCERRILRMVAHGLTNKQMAARLGRGVTTVNSQVHSVLVKMGADCRHTAKNLYWGLEFPNSFA